MEKTRLTRKVADGYITKIWDKVNAITKLARKVRFNNIEGEATPEDYRYLMMIDDYAHQIFKDLVNMQQEKDVI